MSNKKNEEVKNQELRLEDFQLSKIAQLDYDCLGNLIDDKTEIKNINSYVKDSNHSLFTPILVYSISFLNKKINLEKYKYNIGIVKLDKYKIIYTTLNEEMYNLYFLKEKKEINEINCDFSNNQKEQYYIYRKSKINEDIEQKNEIIDMLNEYTNNLMKKYDEKEYLLEDLNYEKLCNLKHEEIISSFRMGYSVQERIIELLKKQQEFIEYPNLLFYEKNDEDIYYREIDRVLFLKKDAEFKLFKTYLILLNNEKEKIIENGEILKLNGNSLNFIEIKRSIYTFEKQLSQYEKEILNDEKNKNEIDEKNENVKEENVSVSKNSYLNKSRTDLYYSIKNIKEFLNIYYKIGIKYKEINLLYIFDSNFSLNFIETLIRLIKFEIYDRSILITSYGNINLYFIHIRSDYEKIDIISRDIIQNNLEKLNHELQENINNINNTLNNIQNENNDLKKRIEKNEKENKDLKENFEKQYNNLKEKNKDLKEKFEKENKDLKKKFEKANKDLKEKFEKENKDLKEKFEKYENEKLIKKTIKNIKLKKILESENIINIDILIGKNYYSLEIGKSIDNINQIIDNNNYKTILDIKTFPKKFIDNNNENIIDFNHYFSKIKAFDNIILIIDQDFINNFEFLKKNFDKYEIKIVIVNLSFYIAILKNSNLVKKETYTVKIENNILPGFKEGEYKFYLDKDLISYFKKLNSFKTNMINKINDEILIYFPDNKAFQFIIKYIYIKTNKNPECIVIKDNNNLLNYSYSIEDIINKYGYQNNLYFLPIEFHDNKLSDILNYFSYNQIVDLNYVNEVLSLENKILYEIINDKNDNYLKLIDEKQNYSLAFAKLKLILKKVNIGDVVNEAKLKKKFIKPNYRFVINPNFPSEKILFFISNIFYMKNLSKEKKILLLGDELCQIKFYLTEIFKNYLLNITHVTNQLNINFGQCFGFIRKINKGNNLLKYLEKSKIDKSNDLINEIENEIINKNILEFIESYKNLNENKYDMVCIDENFVDIQKSLTIPSFGIFSEKIILLEKMINENGIICFNLIGKNKIFYDKIKDIINENFIVLKDEKKYCNGYFILTKNSKIIEDVKENLKNNLFNSGINLDVEGFINNFISKNNYIIHPLK